MLSLFRRKQAQPLETGPLFEPVREAMSDVQAYARSHGGTIELVGVSDEGDVKVRFRGACNGCPLSAVTLKTGIEQRLRELVPGVKRVMQVK